MSPVRELFLRDIPVTIKKMIRAGYPPEKVKAFIDLIYCDWNTDRSFVVRSYQEAFTEGILQCKERFISYFGKLINVNDVETFVKNFTDADPRRKNMIVKEYFVGIVLKMIAAGSNIHKTKHLKSLCMFDKFLEWIRPELLDHVKTSHISFFLNSKSKNKLNHVSYCVENVFGLTPTDIVLSMPDVSDRSIYACFVRVYLSHK